MSFIVYKVPTKETSKLVFLSDVQDYNIFDYFAICRMHSFVLCVFFEQVT